MAKDATDSRRMNCIATFLGQDLLAFVKNHMQRGIVLSTVAYAKTKCFP